MYTNVQNPAGMSGMNSGNYSTLTYASGSSNAAMFMDISSEIPSTGTADLEEWANASMVTDPNDGKPAKKQRRTHLLSLGQKLKIITDIEAGRKRRQILDQYKLAPSTLSTILAHKDEIKKAISNADYSSQRRRIRKSKYHEMEEVLWDWYKQTTSVAQGEPITTTLICKKALNIASEMGMSDFKATNGWVCRFRERRGLVVSPAAKLAKIKAPPPVNPDLMVEWTTNIVPDIMRKYDPNDVFIAHETGIFYRCTPDRMLPFVGERCGGGKLAKDRLTVMLVCNMTGTVKLPLLVVSKFARPKSLKSVQTLPTEYVSNKKAWMIPVFFEEWLKKFDQNIENTWRRVALFLNTSASHPHVESLSAVTLVFLPPNIDLQPATQGIVQALKANYRSILIQKFLDKIEQKGPYGRLEISMLDSLLWLREAWNAVSPQRIIKAFGRAGLHPHGQEDNSSVAGTSQQSSPESVYYALFERLAGEIALEPSITADSYLSLDSHLVTLGVMSSLEMMMAAEAAMDPKKQEEEEDDEDEDLEGVAEAAPSYSEAKQCLSTLLKFFEHFNGQQESFKYISDMEHFVHKLSNTPAKQTTILDYFTKRANKKSKVPKPSQPFFFPRS